MTAADIDIAALDPGQLAALERSLERDVLAGDFRRFVERFWPVIEPGRPLLPSVATDALCAVLQAAAEEGGRWAISCPPGVSKSLLCAVAWPAWLLLRSGGRERIMAGSYSWEFASRDSRRCRDLIESAEYQALVGNAWSLRADANTRSDYWTTAGGRRLITSTEGKSTGERVNVQIMDDVLSAADAHSEAKRRDATRWVNEVLPSRLDDPERATRIMVGQRLHPADPIATAIEQGWHHLNLPALATEEPCELRRADGSLIWRDPRSPGEPLFSLLGRDALDRLKQELGSAAFAAQYQQSPRDEEAAMFKRAWLERRWTELPDLDRTVIALDASFKESSSADFAVIQAWGSKGGDRYLLEQWRKQAGFSATKEALAAMASRYPFAKIVVEEGANGHAIVDALSRELPAIVPVKPEGGKLARAASVQAIVESGALVLPQHAPWLEAWLDEVTGFPNVKNDDQTDAMVYALRALQTSSSYEAFLRAYGTSQKTIPGATRVL